MRRNTDEKLIKKLFSLHPKQSEIIDHFISDGRATSESDVVRQALTYYHDKIFPNYIFHLTPAGKKKDRENKKLESLETMPDGIFATTKLHARIMVAESGQQYALFHDGFNGHRIIPLEQVKKWAEENPLLVGDHENEVKAGKSLENNWFSLKTKNELQELGIVL